MRSQDKSRDNTQAERGGLIHRRKHVCPRSNRAYCERELNITGMRTFLAHFHSKAVLDQGTRVFAYNLLVIEFKGILLNLKIVALAISVE